MGSVLQAEGKKAGLGTQSTAEPGLSWGDRSAETPSTPLEFESISLQRSYP